MTFGTTTPLCSFSTANASRWHSGGSATDRRWKRWTPTRTCGRTPRDAPERPWTRCPAGQPMPLRRRRREVCAPQVHPQGSVGATARVSGVVQGESACKPASVPREVPGWRPSIWDRRCRRPRAVHQGTRPGQPPRPRCAAGASPIRPCSGWGLPSRPVTRPLVRSYRTVSPLPPRSRGVAVCSLWHCPAGRPDWRLASTLPCGGRTFLDPGEPGPRPPSRLPLHAKYATRTRPGGSILGAWSPSWPSPSSSSRWPSWRC